MEGLEYALERTVVIVAPANAVFRYFTDSGRFAAWWGPGSRIDPRVGGEVYIKHPNAVVAGGTVLEIQPPRRIVFTYGFETGKPIPIGASRVTVEFDEVPAGTKVRLRHELPAAGVRDEHIQGWRYQLALFANVVSRETHAGAAVLADRFFALWNETDAQRRRDELATIAVPSLTFRDAYSCTEGVDDLNAHIGASQRFMPGVVLARVGDTRFCQGVAVVEWAVRGARASAGARGVSVFEVAPDGRIAKVTGVAG